MAPLDDAAVAAVRDLYSDLEIDGRVLDLGESSAATSTCRRTSCLEADPERFHDALVRRRPVSNGVAPRPTFAEAARVLRPGGCFVCTFAGSGKSDDAGRVRIVRGYFAEAPGFGPAESDLRTSLNGTGDRLWAVWAKRSGS